MLTFLLIFGIITLGMVLVKKSKKPTLAAKTVNLEEPAGSEIKKIFGTEDKLHILVKGGNQADRIIIFDTQERQKVLTITIN